MLNLEDIKELIKTIDQSMINEFTYEKDDVKIKIRKSDIQSGNVQQIIQQPIPESVPVVVETNQPEQMETVEKVINAEKQDTGLTEIVSPMVGTFYRKPSPDSENYVNVGDQINESTVVCIVEAMKLFNEIEAEVTGEIVEILVDDGELVEYGQPLFKVKAN